MARASGTLQNLTVREGDQVSAGQIIARVEPSEYNQRYRQAQLHAQAAQAQMDIAQRQYDNNMALRQDDFVSPTALDISRAHLDAARANYRAAQAAAAVAQHSVEGTVLNAPITGTVSRRLTQPGETVIPEQPVVEIVDLSRLELQVPVSPSNSLEVRAGQTARLTIEGVPGVMTATVTRINPSTEHGHSDVLAYLALPAQLPGLHQGLFAQGVLQTEEKRALTVPLEAVRTDKPQPYVQIVRNGRVHGVPVQMGQIGTVRSAGDNAAAPDDDEPWIAVRALDGAENGSATGSKTGSGIPGGGNPAAATGIGPGDWVLSSAVGALAENTGVKLPPSQLQQSRP
jgi:RND family efflux transporter MFP subunit